MSFYFTGAGHRDTGTVCMSDSRAGVEYLKNKHCQFENAAMLGVIQIISGQSVFLESTCRVNKYLAKNLQLCGASSLVLVCSF